uniref:D-isomer specific 2-hydroxyacid dehydrogenase NAD-binding domain-containing protein n=1 Tax=Aegilops tauschii subsp. strangulata TaxID=200361 RepID=A0A453AAY9_AEGTS
PELFSMDNVVLSGHRAVATPESIRGTIELIAAPPTSTPSSQGSHCSALCSSETRAPFIYLDKIGLRSA